MSGDRQAWAKAFLRQGDSDLEIYELRADQPSDRCPRCHCLHYLQMACEKIGKAYRIRDTNAKLHGEGGLLRSHVGFAKFMSGFLHSPCVTSRYQGKRALHERVRKATLTLAREIEKLAPAVDEEVSPENAEYPWEAAGRVVAPRDHDFSRLSLLREPGGRVLLKLLKQAVADF